MMSPRSFLFYNRQPSSKRIPPRSAPQSSSTHTRPSATSKTTSSLPARKNDDDKSASNVTITVTPVPTSAPAGAAMGRRKDTKDTAKLSPSSPPTTTTSLTTRPTTPTSPVQIPTRPKRENAHSQRRQPGQRRPQRPRDVHSPKSIPPSMVALLAVTDIPRPRARSPANSRKGSGVDESLTLDAIIERQQVSEKELSLSLDRNPMDLLLSAPEDLDDDDTSMTDSALGSVLSTRTVSLESMPSLTESFPLGASSSLDYSPMTPPTRGRRSRPTRMSLEPVSSPPGGEPEEHPLSVPDEIEVLDFRVFQASNDQSTKKSNSSFPLLPLRSAFKSNLTASLRAIRSAAKSFSAFNLPSIPPDDFLTRSILTIDPRVPYTDERRPPVLEEEPSAALRRYLNPTSNSRIETQPAMLSTVRTYTASIQMRTYKVERSRSSSPSRQPYPSASVTKEQATPYQPQPQSPHQTAFSYPPGAMRQREMRENPDFIRIAVMEMAMCKRGKLSDERPGRARWALPPRKPSTRPYEIRADGVPARWIPVSH